MLVGGIRGFWEITRFLIAKGISAGGSGGRTRIEGEVDGAPEPSTSVAMNLEHPGASDTCRSLELRWGEISFLATRNNYL